MHYINKFAINIYSMSTYYPLQSGENYHIYNRTTANINCFKNERNYNYFLTRYADLIMPIADTLAYTLLPNEYHFVVKLSDEKSITKIFPKSKKNSCELLSQQFGRLFLSYTNAFNKESQRKGALFLKPFRRRMIDDHLDLIHTIKRIHLKPVEHNLCNIPEAWPHSSYRNIINYQPSLVSINPMEEFISMDAFIKFHEVGIKPARLAA
jgi:putative transposase